MKVWNFPNANGLGIQGISNGGVETFKGEIIESLTREICQNSLDACNGKKPVKIIFKQSIIEKEFFPGFDEIKNYMYAAKLYWQERNDKKSVEFFSNACKILESNRISVLQVSDYNTTGLTGCDDPKENSAWFSMVTSEGVSNKSGSDGGSYGIGKSSIYAASSLRTVFFNTYDIDEKSAAEGVSKLTRFELNGDKKFGLGYYGELDSKGLTKSCESIDELDELSFRNEYGTDIFIMGFNKYSNWKETIIISLLENFLLAIYNSELEVTVQDCVVNNETLEKLLEKYKENCPSAYNYYDVLKSDEEIIENSQLFPKIQGTVKLKIKIFKDSLANRTVLMSRSNGMKLFDKNRISGSIQFSAILTMQGEELSQYFARMEDPTHTKWEPGRYEQESLMNEARKNLNALNKWIKETIVQKGTEAYDEEIEIKGMEGLLPAFSELISNKNRHETLENNKSKITVVNKKKERPSINIQTETNGSSYYEYVDTGDLDENGEYKTIDVPHNENSKEKNGTGAPANGKDGEGNRPIIKFAQVNNYKKGIFISNVQKNEYTIKITVNQDIEDCRLQVFISGETANIDAYVQSATSEGKNLKVTQNIIHLGRLYKRFPKTIKFTVESDYQCNLEVKLYANKK